jgi:hypothetical protein
MPPAEIMATTIAASFQPRRVSRSHRIPAAIMPLVFTNMAETPMTWPTRPALTG